MVYYRDKYNRHNQKKRAAVLALLGGICCRCGFEDSRALQVDHINGGGTLEKKKMGGAAYWNLVIRSVLAGEFKYQLLCANCNWIKRWENNEMRGRPRTHK